MVVGSMIKKFRNSLLGFNREDVNKFILETKINDETNKQKISELNNKIEELHGNISELTLLHNQTVEMLKEAEARIENFKKREDALTALSESIGRLYLVAEANAKSIMQSANDSAEMSQKVVDRNIEIASKAENELAEISELLNSKTLEYTEVINRLQLQLTDIKRKIEDNQTDIEERKSELAFILK